MNPTQGIKIRQHCKETLSTFEVQSLTLWSHFGVVNRYYFCAAAKSYFFIDAKILHVTSISIKQLLSITSSQNRLDLGILGSFF